MPISLSQVLSVILALAVVYYVLGLVVSVITKYALEIMNTRGRCLEGFLKKNLLGMVKGGKSELLNKLKEMPQLNSLKPVRYAKKLGLPVGFVTGKTEIINYVEQIPPKNLVDAFFDLSGTFKKGNEKVQEVIGHLPDQLPGLDGNPVGFTIKTELQKLADDGFDDLDALRSKMETWFGGMMDQAAMEFKAQARRIVILLSLVVAFIFGVDSIELAKLYWNNAALSATADAQANLILGSTNDENQKNADIQKLTAQLEEMKAINFKWYNQPTDAPANWLFLKFLGILITAFAVSQGTSFWYDMMKQLKGDQSPTPPDTTTVTTSPGGIRSIQTHHKARR